MKKLGPLKGRAVVAQSGGCTAVINASLTGVIQGVRDVKAITDLWGSLHGVEGLLEGAYIDLLRQTASRINRIHDLPSSSLGSSRYKLRPGQEYEVLERLSRRNIRYLFMIGGNDTAETGLAIGRAAGEKKYALRLIHIPKTIDNDLEETDHSPGYGSAARFAAITTQEAGLDTRAMRRVDPVKIIEFMGRNSGWIVAASALLRKAEEDPPHLILVPEVPFRQAEFLDKVENILGKIGYCVVTISETIRDARGRRLGALREGVTQDAFGHQYVEGAAYYLTRLIEKKFRVRARFDKPGTIQRMAVPYVSGVDRDEAFQAGRTAVAWAVRGLSGVMVSFRRKKGTRYGIEYCPVPLRKIPRREKYLPASYLNGRKDNVSPVFRRYALPLIGKPVPDFPGWEPLFPG